MAKRYRPARKERELPVPAKPIVLLRQHGLKILAGVCLVFCLSVTLLGGSLLPSWQQLFRYAGISNGSPAVCSDDADSPTQVHFIDVGQGDSVLILQDGKAALIDAGTEESASAVVSYLAQLDIKELDLLVLTHPHADHDGGMAQVLRRFAVKQLWLPCSNNTEEGREAELYSELLHVAEEQDIPRTQPSLGDTLPLGSGTVTVVSVGTDSENENNNSLCVLFSVGDFSFLDTGDSETEAEEQLVQNGLLTSCTLYKAGHHGSSTANGELLLETIHPQIAVISCGEDNDYGHPHAEALQHLTDAGAVIFRTDLSGGVAVCRNESGKISVYTTKNFS